MHGFLRRKGNTFYLVHNVREGGQVKQLHLAKLGERPRITDDVVRQVTRSYPFVDVNWTRTARASQQSCRTVRPQIQPRSKTRFHSAHSESRSCRPVSAACWMFRTRRKRGKRSSPSFVFCIPRLVSSSTNLTAPRTGVFQQTGSTGRRQAMSNQPSIATTTGPHAEKRGVAGISGRAERKSSARKRASARWWTCIRSTARG